MKFKVGDKVKIKDDLEIGEEYGVDILFISNMNVYKGMIATITHCNTTSYKLDIDGGIYGWTDEMLEEIPITCSNTDISILSDTTQITTIKVDGIVQRLEIYEKGETNLMKILDIYKENREKELRNAHDTATEVISNNDEILKEINKINKKLIKAELPPISTSGRFTKETQELLDNNNKLFEEAMVKLEKYIAEVKAQLELCETYEQKIQVLINYDIIDKETKKVK